MYVESVLSLQYAQQERRAGPGEEVEVEVIKNYGSPDAHSSLFRGKRAEAQQHLKEYLGRLRKAVDDNTAETRQKAEKDNRKGQQSAHSAKEMVKEVVAEGPVVAGSGHDSSEPPLDQVTNTAHEFAIEDEESEDEDITAAKKQRSKSPRSKTLKTGGRRRNSIRRGLMGRVMKSPDTSSSSKPSAVNELDERGRNLGHPSSEVEGTRSIRFFDEAPSSRPGSGTTTPRHESLNLRSTLETPPDEQE
ncbi:hypothetical protein GG344DRAFT_83929 [Lentinula edodes]|nr:hypothetical protein GG344DRAFT_83929 [Lentinula edodes]